MKTRRFSFYLPVALAGLVAGAVLAAWTSYGNIPTETMLVQSASVSPQHSATADIANAPPKLRLDDRLSHGGQNEAVSGDSQPKREEQSLRDYAASQQAKQKQQSTDVMTTEPSEPLDLDLPKAMPGTMASAGNEAPASGLSANSSPRAGTRLEFNASPAANPEVDSYNLFNPDYGLRGFMKQRWVNQSFAFQGGLGLNDERVLPAESDLHDSIAFGMGVIVAF